MAGFIKLLRFDRDGSVPQGRPENWGALIEIDVNPAMIAKIEPHDDARMFDFSEPGARDRNGYRGAILHIIGDVGKVIVRETREEIHELIRQLRLADCYGID